MRRRGWRGCPGASEGHQRHLRRPRAAGPARLEFCLSWAPGGYGPSRTWAPAQSLQDPPDPVGDNPGAGSRALRAHAGVTQAHSRPTELGSGRAGAHLPGGGSVLYAVPTSEARSLRQGPSRRLRLS
ncbi:hypothetical protein NDU88_003645 [Pleurodeles waltl]|uniref:Uncharacterized protein n=1 Tax=Pleurodeles waltl TaxID=8319 RepID=A0AAV7UD46_PLEWA|nr:hypothetical protein NDU88_003645 [Pleurodeles waltl]